MSFTYQHQILHALLQGSRRIIVHDARLRCSLYVFSPLIMRIPNTDSSLILRLSNAITVFKVYQALQQDDSEYIRGAAANGGSTRDSHDM